MKKLLCFLIFITSTTLYSQRNSSFVGNWIWKNNNQVFLVHLYEEGRVLKGDYQLSKKDSLGNQKILYKSNKLINKEFKMYYGHAINGRSNDGKVFNGSIRDNVLLGDKIHTIRNGELTLLKDSENTLIWNVTFIEIYNRRKNLKVPEKFSIPTDIILTRQKK
jgi:hypothetical protein